MNPDDLRRLLEAVRAGSVGIEAASAQIAPAVADLGFAHVDLHRRQRCGFPEVIFCQGKTPGWVEGVVAQLAARGQDRLATRVSHAQAPLAPRVPDERAAPLPRLYPHAEQDRVARTFWLPATAGARPLAGHVL